jgi:hypothetical protein
MCSINLPDAVCSVRPASFPRPESSASDAESIDPRFEFDGLAKALGDLGLLIRFQRVVSKLPPPFFFDFFAAVDEGR